MRTCLQPHTTFCKVGGRSSAAGLTQVYGRREAPLLVGVHAAAHTLPRLEHRHVGAVALQRAHAGGWTGSAW